RPQSPRPAAVAPPPHTAASLPPTDKASADLRCALLPAETIPGFSASAPPPCCACRTAPEFPPAASDPAALRHPASDLPREWAVPRVCSPKKNAKRCPYIDFHRSSPSARPAVSCAPTRRDRLQPRGPD